MIRSFSLIAATTAILSTTAWGQTGTIGGSLFPEDGSGFAKRWCYSSTLDPLFEGERDRLAALREEMNPYGILMTPVDAYEHLQDIALFSRDGRLLHQPPYRSGTGLTMGVYGDRYHQASQPSPVMLAEAGIGCRELQWTTVEGGELISGTLPSGEPYAIFTDDVVTRLQQSYPNDDGSELTKTEALKRIATDFRVPVANLYVVPDPGEHLDLVLWAVPASLSGGSQPTVLLHDPTLVAPTLQRIVEQGKAGTEVQSEPEIGGTEVPVTGRPIRITPHEIKALQAMIERPQALSRNLGRPEMVDALNDVADALAPHVTVVRVAGVFAYATQDKPAVRERANFFNGFQSRFRLYPDAGKTTPKTLTNAEEGIVVFTNRAPDMPALEAYWRQTLTALGYDARHIHFVGHYSNGAGLDCDGSLCGGR